MLSFFYDVVCPYAYMAATRIDALAARQGQTVRWVPVLLGGLFKSQGAPQVPATTWAASKQLLGLKDTLRMADRLGVPLNFPLAHPRRTVGAMRLCVAADDATRPALSLALFRAYWVEGRDVGDPAVLAEIAVAHGLPKDAHASPLARQGLFENTEIAGSKGAFGVPTMAVGDEIYWGVDRLHLVEGALSGQRVQPQAPLGNPGQQISFYHDFSSPFSYLGASAVGGICARQGATVDWRPILLGALFRSIGTPDVPLFTFSPEKQRYMLKDLHRWAEFWGVPFAWPPCFPVRTILPLRVALQAPEATLPLYRALWAEGRDIGQDEVVVDVLTDAGLDAAALVEGAADPAIKQRLFANNAAAEAAGVCGVPGFVLEDGMVLWGQDRLFLLDACLSGWRPRLEAR